MRFAKALTGRSASLSEYLEWVNINGQQFPLLAGGLPTLGAKQSYPDGTFPSFVYELFRTNPIVYACIDRRLSLFSEARLKYRRLVQGRPGELFGLPSLSIFEEPWPRGNTGELLKMLLLDSDLQGNGYAVRRRIHGQDKIVRLRPDWVTLVIGVNGDPKAGFGALDSEVVGYIYEPGGRGGSGEPVPLLPETVAHFKPKQDPLNPFRGMSWLTPVLRDVLGDKAATEHKQSYLEDGAVPSMVVKSPELDPESFKLFKEIFEEKHSGALNSFKTIFLGGGADATVVGSNMRQVDFKSVQGLGENRICVASGVPSIIAGVAEGLAASTYSNVQQAKRLFGDLMQPEWRAVCGALSTLAEPPSGSELWFDDRDIPFLREDGKDEAEVQFRKAQTVATLVKEGFTPDSAVAFVDSNDITTLKHTGMVSVQLHPPGKDEQPLANGNGNMPSPAST